MRWLLAIIIACMLFWALLLIFALSPKVSHGTTLTYTVPTQGQYRWVDPSQGADSVMVECSGSDSVQVDSVILFKAALTGGGYQRVAAHYVRGSEGSADTFEVGPGNYYALAKNGAGVSCVGNVAYVPPSDITGVEPVPQADVIRWKLFDVRGRLAERPLASGIYYRKEWTKRGVRVRRVVVVR
jgi:hypothetical protein